MQRRDKNNAIKAALTSAQYHRNRLEVIAKNLASLFGMQPESDGAKDLRSAVFGEIDFAEAMLRIIDRELQRHSAIQIEGVIDPQTA